MTAARSDKVDVANVFLWGERVGAIAMENNSIGRFEYASEFVRRGLDIGYEK